MIYVAKGPRTVTNLGDGSEVGWVWGRGRSGHLQLVKCCFPPGGECFHNIKATVSDHNSHTVQLAVIHTYGRGLKPLKVQLLVVTDVGSEEPWWSDSSNRLQDNAVVTPLVCPSRESLEKRDNLKWTESRWPGTNTVKNSFQVALF